VKASVPESGSHPSRSPYPLACAIIRRDGQIAHCHQESSPVEFLTELREILSTTSQQQNSRMQRENAPPGVQTARTLQPSFPVPQGQHSPTTGDSRSPAGSPCARTEKPVPCSTSSGRFSSYSSPWSDYPFSSRDLFLPPPQSTPYQRPLRDLAAAMATEDPITEP
jgi:hypothetical protein